MSEDQFYELIHKYLKREITKDEQILLENHLANDNNSRALFDSLTKSTIKKSSTTELQAKLERIVASSRLTSGATAEKKPVRIPFKITAIAAAAIGILFLFSAILLQKNHKAKTSGALAQTINTKNAERKKITLPDGTIVWLNSGSHISYLPSFGKTDRNIQLEGEAFFEVTSNKELPMIVSAKEIKIKVIGTSFNIKSYSDEDTYEASLVEGKIELYVDKKNQSAGQVYHLIPGEKIKIRTNLTTDQQSIDQPVPTEEYRVEKTLFGKKADGEIPSEIAWKEDKLAFDSEPLSTAVLKMEKWYDTKIELQNVDLANLSVTGTFTEKHAEDVLEILQYGGANFKYKKQNQKIIIY